MGEHDRPVAPDQQRRLHRPELDELARGLEIARHQRERLLLAVLARPQPRDRLLVAGQAREVVPADALDGDDAAVAQQRGDLVERVREPRSAGGAGVGLGVEAAVRRVGVLGRAGAHIVKPAIVVSGRSYGTPRTIVKRGPQSVQLMNG